MEAKELGSILKGLYDNAKRGQQVTKIHLFGIKYSEEILKAGIRQVIIESGIRSTYATEVSKGVNLADWVKLTKDIQE